MVHTVAFHHHLVSACFGASLAILVLLVRRAGASDRLGKDGNVAAEGILRFVRRRYTMESLIADFRLCTLALRPAQAEPEKYQPENVHPGFCTFFCILFSMKNPLVSVGCESPPSKVAT